MLTDKEKFLIAAHDGQVEDKVYITGRLVKATVEIERLRALLIDCNTAMFGYLSMQYTAAEATNIFRETRKKIEAALSNEREAGGK